VAEHEGEVLPAVGEAFEGDGLGGGRVTVGEGEGDGDAGADRGGRVNGFHVVSDARPFQI
jgi:hypothetical protein